MGWALLRWLLVVASGLGLAIAAAYWIACTGTDNVLSYAILVAHAVFNLRDPWIWLLLGALVLWQNRRWFRLWVGTRQPIP